MVTGFGKVFNGRGVGEHMQVKLLKTIISSVAGQQAPNLVDSLYGKKNVNEFLIAKKLKLTINQTRNILYKLADEGLVSFTRKKDAKKGGWYTYYWTLNTGKSFSRFRELLQKEIEGIKAQIQNRKTATFFYCPNCEMEFTQESSLLHDYTCPECGEILQVKDTSAEVSSLEKEILKRAELLTSVDIELADILGKEEKAKIRKDKAEAKKKKIERDLKRKKNAKEKKKNALKKK